MLRVLTRRWRFALALLLAAVTLAIVGFWFQSWRAQREFEETVAMIEGKGGKVIQVESSLGVDGVCCVDLQDARLTRADLQRIARLPNLTTLNLDHACIDDEALSGLKGAPSLSWLLLNRTNVTDEGLRELCALPVLRQIELLDTGVTEEGLSLLKKTAASRTDPRSRSISIIVSGPSVQPGLAVKLSASRLRGTRSDLIKMSGQFRLQAGPMTSAYVGCRVRGQDEPSNRSSTAGQSIPQLLEDGDWHFETSGSVEGLPATPLVARAELDVMFPEGRVIYHLGETTVIETPKETSPDGK